MHFPRTVKAWLAPLVALLVASMQLGGAVHLSTVRHAVCQEHGEVIDVPRTQLPTVPLRTSLVAAGERHGHDHCTVHALVASRDAHGSPSSARSPRGTTVRHGSLGAPPRAIAILSFAPKSSPPV